MQRWKMTLSYDGTSFHGWQVQPGLSTVQGTLAEALRQLTGESVLPQGSGRTDTGVHALAQVATVDIDCAIPAENLLRALNRSLPASVRVLEVSAVRQDFHARHSAVHKTYEYRLFPGAGTRDRAGAICSPMLAPYVWDCPLQLDLRVMQQASRSLLGTHDFTSFASSDPDRSTRLAGLEPPAHATNTRTLDHSCWQEIDGLYIYRVAGDGFLHHMVRNLVGTLTEVGRGYLEADALPAILSACNRTAAGPTAPARGLFLVKVDY